MMSSLSHSLLLVASPISIWRERCVGTSLIADLVRSESKNGEIRAMRRTVASGHLIAA